MAKGEYATVNGREMYHKLHGEGDDLLPREIFA